MEIGNRVFTKFFNQFLDGFVLVMKTFKIPDDFCFVFKKITNHLQLFFFISFWKTPLKHLTYFSICSINYKVQSGVACRRVNLF